MDNSDKVEIFYHKPSDRQSDCEFYVKYEKIKKVFNDVRSCLEATESELNELDNEVPGIKSYVEELRSDPRRDESLDSEKAAEYNNKLRNKPKACCVEWYKVKKESGVSRLSKIKKAPLVKTMEQIQYQGPCESEKIISCVEKCIEKFGKRAYCVYSCPKCNAVGWGEILNGMLKCRNCSQSFDADSDNVIIKFEKYATETNRVNAQNEFERRKNPGIPATGESVKSPFTYKNRTYQCTYIDFVALIKTLYGDFAYDSVFETKDGETRFVKSFKTYLQGINNNEYFQMAKNIETKINRIGASLFLRSVKGAFYMFCKCLLKNVPLVWKLNEKIVTYNNKENYVSALIKEIDGGTQLDLSLLELFNELTCADNELFAGYDPNDDMEISRLIYDNTNPKRFIYVSREENKASSFGSDFVSKLNMFDEKIEERYKFIEKIRLNSKFWDAIKNGFDENIADEYLSSDNIYEKYEKLCLYQFFIDGSKVFRYKRLCLEMGNGIEKIKGIIIENYQKGTCNDDLQDLIELCKNEGICQMLGDMLSGYREHVSWGETSYEIGFNSLKDNISKISRGIPIELYLDSMDLADDRVREVQIRYAGKLLTFNEHIDDIMINYSGPSLSCALKDFYNNKDVQGFISYILPRLLSQDHEQFMGKHKKGFNELENAIHKLAEEYQELLKRTQVSENMAQ